MLLLVIDTSGADCAAAVYDTDSCSLIGVRQETIGKGHAEKLLSMIDEVLADAAVESDALEKIGVVIGPGSFTGIRVGVSFARGFALALGIPVVGVSALEALAHEAQRGEPSKAVLAAIDAKRDQVYVQKFDETGAACSEPAAISVDQARLFHEAGYMRLVGSGANLIAGSSGEKKPVQSLSLLDIAEIAVARESEKPTPLYLRAPDAKPQMGFAVARR